MVFGILFEIACMFLGLPFGLGGYIPTQMAERCLIQFNAQGLANTAWALTDSAACALESS